MTWTLDIKGFRRQFKNKNLETFVAIVPIWSGYSKHYNLRPINHIKLTGIAVSEYQYHRLKRCEWHPDNCFSEEKWIELHLYWCKWSLNEYERLVIQNRHFLNEYNNPVKYRFFVPAKQLQQLATEELIYKSKDREDEERQIYVQAWGEMTSSAIANSYY
jgi:hypothetical protein